MRAGGSVIITVGAACLQRATGGGDVAQSVEHRTGTPLTQVPFPGAARDFCPRVNFQYGISYCVRSPSCAIAYIYIRRHGKDPVVNVKGSVDYKNTKTPKMHRRLGSATLLQPAFPRRR